MRCRFFWRRGDRWFSCSTVPAASSTHASGASGAEPAWDAAVDQPGIFRLSWNLNGAARPCSSIYLQRPAPETATPDANAAKAVTGAPGDQALELVDPAGKLVREPGPRSWSIYDPQGHSLGFLRAGAVGEGRARRLSVTIYIEQPAPRIYGGGNAVPGLLHTEGHAHVGNGIAVTPFLWASAGWAVLAISDDDNAPARWDYHADFRTITWRFPGARGDLYIAPAATLGAALTIGARLTGFPPVPPRWTFGYMQSRWGWKNRADLEATLREFRTRRLPVDAFILDFEWYTKTNDYKVAPGGVGKFPDFGWNKVLFPEPRSQLASYMENGLRIAAIRKPRLADRATLQEFWRKGWMLRPHTDKTSYPARNMNFALPEVRDWYAGQLAPFVADGVAGWWNDEGEASYTLYHYWNLAERMAAEQARPGARFWSLNRAFSPGLQRLGAAAWTGDIDSTWGDLADTPPSLLNWSLAGMIYGGCDIGGFKHENSPELLVRWMQAGVFFPVMRSHSSFEITPRFPWLYGMEAERAIRLALELRYRLLPYLYTLAHDATQTGWPLMRPMAMVFPDDVRLADVTDQWMLGDRVLVAPVLARGGRREVMLPEGGWYRFESSELLAGGRTLRLQVPLDEIPVFVRAGTLLPLGPVVQSTAFLPGGPLELQIYPGADAAARLIEDDGATLRYRDGEVRETNFRWEEAQRRLTWQQQGAYSGPGIYQVLRVRHLGTGARLDTEQPLSSTGECRG